MTVAGSIGLSNRTTMVVGGSTCAALAGVMLMTRVAADDAAWAGAAARAATGATTRMTGGASPSLSGTRSSCGDDWVRSQLVLRISRQGHSHARTIAGRDARRTRRRDATGRFTGRRFPSTHPRASFLTRAYRIGFEVVVEDLVKTIGAIHRAGASAAARGSSPPVVKCYGIRTRKNFCRALVVESITVTVVPSPTMVWNTCQLAGESDSVYST